ncbi:DUF5960 family protein [Enterococcus sp. AZ163]|uniref:DUF5960 family protein n=1 Tax=Enterococcus sp. AZ163 TaxID=2774638 RepID=UPI003D2E6AA6
MLEVHRKDFAFKDDKFIAMFHKYVNADIPLFALQKELLYIMETQKINHFRVPASLTKNNKEAVFYFDITTLKQNITFDVYRLREVKFFDEEGNELFSK